jgi:Tol biopolymer transport system component
MKRTSFWCFALACWVNFTAWAADLIPVSVAFSTNPPSLSGNDFSSLPTLTPDGRLFVFVSGASNLTTNDSASSRLGPVLNVFVRDHATRQTTLVSVTTDGLHGGNGNSISPEISADGRYVVFESEASNLSSNDTNNAPDIFVRDLQAGRTILVSVNADATGTGNRGSTDPIISPDGRFVVFESGATNLVRGEPFIIGSDVYVRDLELGTTTILSRDLLPTDTGSFGSSASAVTASISTNGARVAFINADLSRRDGIFVRDLISGKVSWVNAQAGAILGTPANRVQVFDAQISGNGRYVAYTANAGWSSAILRYDIDNDSTTVVATNAIIFGQVGLSRSGASITPDGRFVLYEATTNYVGTDNSLFVWDDQSESSSLATPNAAGTGPAGGRFTQSVLSSDGRWLSFISSSTDLVTNALTGTPQAFVRDLVLGQTRLLSVDAQGEPVSDEVLDIALPSADGRLAVFGTAAAIDGGDRNNVEDIYLRDTDAGLTELVSRVPPQAEARTAAGWSTANVGGVSANGRLIVFQSTAENLVAGDTNGVQDVFLRDLQSGTTALVSVSTNGGSANGASFHPVISLDGTHVAFLSRATDLASGATNNLPGLYVRDLVSATTILASRAPDGTAMGADPAGTPFISADGTVAVYGSPAASTPGVVDLFHVDLQTGNTLRVNDAQVVGWFGCSSDGRYVGYTAGAPHNTVVVWDAQTQTNIFVGARTGLLGQLLSPDGRTLYYSSAGLLRSVDIVSGADVQIGLLVQPAPIGSVATSADQRWVAYVASNQAAPVAGGPDTSGVTDIVLFDRQAVLPFGTLITRNRNRSSAAGPSDSPVLSADGRFLAFRSYAADLAAGDSNAISDVFVFDRQNNNIVLLSRSATGGSGNAMSLRPILSANGNTLVFTSVASDLVSGDDNSMSDVFALALADSLAADSDHDGLPDAWEMYFFGTLDQTGSDDFDQDGYSNLAEFIAGTDPTDPGAAFRIQSASSADGQLSMSWNITPFRTYRIEFKDDLSATDWSPSTEAPVVSGNLARFAPALALDSSQRFYRVVVSLP